ncbi:MAG: 3'(2'),5'-bisphosphate nucleotidase CysQ family protein [Alphaproteobacteria bacterium]
MLENSLRASLLGLMCEAGDRLCELYRQNLQPITKADGSPVTQADQEIDVLVQRELAKLTPEIPVISEESAFYPERLDPQAPFWLLDPLDGTRAFLGKSGEFVINLALIQEEKPVCGIIHIPLTQETYLAFQGEAFYAKKNHMEPLASPPAPLQWTALVGSTSTTVPEPFRHFPIQQVQQVQSALKFCWLAAGKAQVSWRFAPCYEWDVAAGQALLEAVGGTVLTYQGEKILYGSRPDYYYTKGLVLYGTQDVQRLACNTLNAQTS